MDKYDITDYLKDDKELQKAVIQELLDDLKCAVMNVENLLETKQRLKSELAELGKTRDDLKAENEKLTSWLASSEKQKKELCNVIHKKKEQIQTLKYMLFDEKEIPKDKFTMYYRIAQNERRTKSHRDLCTNVAKKYKQTLQEIKEIAEQSNVDCIYRISVIRKILTKAEEE